MSYTHLVCSYFTGHPKLVDPVMATGMDEDEEGDFDHGFLQWGPVCSSLPPLLPPPPSDSTTQSFSSSSLLSSASSPNKKQRITYFPSPPPSSSSFSSTGAEGREV